MNLYLLAPELSLCILAVVVILLDLVVDNKGVVAAVSALGLLIPAAVTIAFWGTTPMTGFFGMLILDNFALFFKLLLLGIALLVIMASTDYVSRFGRSQGEYYALVLLSCGGMMLLAATRELISIYISLELTGISLYALAGFLKDEKSSEAGLKYLLLGALSSAVLLYGMALLFGLTGTTDLAGIARVMPAVRVFNYPALLLAMVLVVAGFGFKIAAVPFQMWVPDVYEGAPTPVTAYLSVASKAAGFAVILRVFYTAMGSPPEALGWAGLFAVLSVFSMTIGNLVALTQTNIKRMLGYSSIAQAGYIMVGLATLSPMGRSGVLFFLASYALTNLGAFTAIIAISNKTGSDLIEGFSGMARRAPVLSLAMAFCLISLTGLPPTAGFFAKLYVFKAAVDYGLIWLVIIAVINSAIAAYYYLRVVKVMYLQEPASAERIPASASLRVALLVSAVAVLVLGLNPDPLLGIAELASRFIIP